jgi:hypothetical protein
VLNCERIRWAELLSHIGGRGDLLKGFVGKTLKITENLKDLDVVGEIMFK